MNPKETQEGVMDRYCGYLLYPPSIIFFLFNCSLLEALQTGSAFSREQKRKRGPRPAGGEYLVVFH